MSIIQTNRLSHSDLGKGLGSHRRIGFNSSTRAQPTPKLLGPSSTSTEDPDTDRPRGRRLGKKSQVRGQEGLLRTPRRSGPLSSFSQRCKTGCSTLMKRSAKTETHANPRRKPQDPAPPNSAVIGHGLCSRPGGRGGDLSQITTAPGHRGGLRGKDGWEGRGGRVLKSHCGDSLGVKGNLAEKPLNSDCDHHVFWEISYLRAVNCCFGVWFMREGV